MSGNTLCGVVTKDTKFAFRSRSAHFTIVVLMSREMWDFALDGELYYEKVIPRDDTPCCVFLPITRQLMACIRCWRWGES